MIKIRYVAQVEIDAEFQRSERTLPIDAINDRVRSETSGIIQNVIQKHIAPETTGTVNITEQYIDVYETEGADNEKEKAD